MILFSSQFSFSIDICCSSQASSFSSQLLKSKIWKNKQKEHKRVKQFGENFVEKTCSLKPKSIRYFLLEEMEHRLWFYIFFLFFLIVYLKSRSEAYLLQQHSTLERTFGAITPYGADDFRKKIKGFIFFNLQVQRRLHKNLVERKKNWIFSTWPFRCFLREDGTERIVTVGYCTAFCARGQSWGRF